jgi:hypothetical protein
MFPINSLLGRKGCCTICPQPEIKNKKFNQAYRLAVTLIIGDALFSVTALVVGILGVLAIIDGISPVVAYAFFTLSGIITLLWIADTIRTKGENLVFVKNLLLDALSSNPKRLNNTL